MKRALSLLAAAVLAVPLSSQAAMTFKFDADGAGTAFSAVDADIFDWAPGSALSVKGNPSGGIDVGDVTKLLFQANLTAVQLGAGNNVLNNGATQAGKTVRFTTVLGFKEVATSATATGVAFDFAGANALSADNFFYIYAVSSLADNLSGSGFVGVTPILSGHVSSVNSSFFNVNAKLGLQNLDQSGSNDWSGVKSIVGSGSTDLNLTIDSVNTDYFPDLMTGTAVTLGFVNSSLVDPFKTTDPSKNFSSNGTTGANYSTNVGPTNGFNTSPTATYDFIFQADANMSFAVPEPGSVGLIGLALTAMGLTARRRRSAK